MIPWEEIERVSVPGPTLPGAGGKCGALSLHRRQAEYSIRVNGCELMNSRVHGSEEALAELVCGPWATAPDVRIMVGGLGMGFSLAACTRCLPRPDATILVLELIPAVVRWCEGPLASLSGDPLRDPRVAVKLGDIREMLAGKSSYHGIVLDVDNGPNALTRATNGNLYTERGLRALWAALKPQGRLGVWSIEGDPGFTRRLRDAGFLVEVQRVPARRGGRGATHTLWIASKP